ATTPAARPDGSPRTLPKRRYPGLFPLATTPPLRELRRTLPAVSASTRPAWMKSANADSLIRRQTDAHEVLVPALFERSLLAMARGDWSQAEDLADQARTACRRPGIEEIGAWIAQARVAAYRGDIPAARQALAQAQRLRPLLTY